MSETFGERLRTLRTAHRLTPSAVAHAVGVTEGAIRQMESGQTKNASFLVGLRLSRLFGVTAWYLATGEDAPNGGEVPGPEASLIELVEQLTLQVHALDRRVRALEATPRTGKRRADAE